MNHKGSSKPFRFETKVDDLSLYPGVVGFSAPIQVEGVIANEDGEFLVSGQMKTRVQMPCDRCLSPVEVEVNVKLSEKLCEKDNAKNEEIETFSGEMIDLAPMVRKNILFSLPMKVVCKEDCKGLCPMCGKDLNQGACDCDTTYINPKFESLRSLFKLDE